MQCACTIFLSIACLVLLYFSTLYHKRHDFRKKIIEHKMHFFFIFSATSSVTFLIVRRTERNMITMYIGIHVRYSSFLLEFNES